MTESKSYTNTFLPVFTGKLFKTAKKLMQNHVHRLVTRKLNVVHNRILFDYKGNKILTHTTTQMNLKVNMYEKNEYFLICFLF